MAKETVSVNSLALLIVRVTLGVIFLAHGMQKLLGVFDGPGIAKVAKMLEGIGFMYPTLWAWILSLSETIGGLFLVLGIMPRLSSGFITIIMLVAIFRVHGPKGFFMANGGFEYPLLILVTAISFMLTGGGKFSFFDRL